MNLNAHSGAAARGAIARRRNPAAWLMLGLLPAAALLFAHPAHADRDDWHHHDGHWDHHYPHRGVVIDSLPPHRTIVYAGHPYHYARGVWYRPFGPRFMVVAPPIGIVVPSLPFGFVTLTIGGEPYYRYGDVYYIHDDGGYRVVPPPSDTSPQDLADTTPAPDDKLFIYPKNGQSEKKQAEDRYDCHEWAVGQTGYDTTLSGGGVSADERSAKRSDYMRAMGACLEGRGYTVK